MTLSFPVSYLNRTVGPTALAVLSQPLTHVTSDASGIPPSPPSAIAPALRVLTPRSCCSSVHEGHVPLVSPSISAEFSGGDSLLDLIYSSFADLPSMYSEYEDTIASEDLDLDSDGMLVSRRESLM
jgi:hypothetical protein